MKKEERLWRGRSSFDITLTGGRCGFDVGVEMALGRIFFG